MFGWWQELGFLMDLIGILHSVWSGGLYLYNGVADTGLDTMGHRTFHK